MSSRYNEDASKVGAIKRNRNVEEPVNEGLPWTREDIDRGMTMYLDGVGLTLIAARLGRSERSVVTFLEHKVYTPKYNKGAVPRYRGKGGRENMHWTARDEKALRRCLQYNWPVESVAVLLARSVTAVRARIEKRQQRGQPRL